MPSKIKIDFYSVQMPEGSPEFHKLIVADSKTEIPPRHLFGAGPARDDARVRKQLVAEGVVAVGVGIDQRADGRRSRQRATKALQHLARELQIEQGIDQQGLALIGHQPRIAVASGTVRQQPRVATVAQIMHALGVLPFRHWLAPSKRHDCRHPAMRPRPHIPSVSAYGAGGATVGFFSMSPARLPRERFHSHTT